MLDLNKIQPDMFPQGIFSRKHWSAAVFKETDGEMLQKKLDSMHLCGRTTRDIRVIGFGYTHVSYALECGAYSQLNDLSEDEREYQSVYEHFDNSLRFRRYLSIDEPLLITFDDGDEFEILADMDENLKDEYWVSMNKIPWWNIKPGINYNNVDANVVLSCCLGHTITDIEVKMEEYNNRTGEYIEGIYFKLDNGLQLMLSADTYFDIFCLDEQNEEVWMDYRELRIGLYNWEDLDVDRATGFETNSNSIYFGDKGYKRCKDPFMSLYSDHNIGNAMYISVDDFTLMGWAITRYKNKIFDEYGEYRFSKSQWFDLLDIADELVAIDDYGELADALINWNGYSENERKHIIYQLENLGEEYWSNQQDIKRQVEDIRSWSKLVLKEDSIMNICGC